MVKRLGILYLLLVLPACYALILALKTPDAGRHAIFLGIFLAYLVLEFTYDFALKLQFRSN